ASQDFSFLPALPDNVVLTALKTAEDEDNVLILRFYESAGKATNFQFSPLAGWEEIREADLMEPAPDSSPPQSPSLPVRMKPYEIKTLRIRVARPATRAPLAPASAKP